jgi:Fic family protein
MDEALVALGRLDAVTTLLPDPALFLYSYVRKEAVLSSQIEGTQSSISDLLLFEIDQAPGAPLDDVSEVSSYVGALQYGLGRIREGFPLSNRLIREMHGVLLSRGRGAEKQPGEFRRTQNWIGGSRPGNAVFVPPPPDQAIECMNALERWLHDDPGPTPPLLKAALAHVQFETIHPFLDGNGRVGRLLITLILCVHDVLHEPLLYLSLYLKQNRSAYYDHLDRVRRDGDWENWLSFFIDGVRETAAGAFDTTKRLTTLFRIDRDRVRDIRRSGSMLQVHAALQEQPIASIANLAQRTRLTVPTVMSALQRLEQLDIVREVTGRRRGRGFSYHQYLHILNEGTEPIPQPGPEASQL